MKKVIFIFIALFTSSGLFAKEYTKDKDCRGLMSYSGLIMKYKQNNKPITEVLEMNDNFSKNKPQHTKELFNIIIRQAYEKPYIEDQELKKIQYNNFIAEQYNFCMTHNN